MELHQQLRYCPFIRLLVPYIIGIILSLHLKISFIPIVILLFITLFIFIILSLSHKKFRNRWLYGVNLSIFLTACSIFQVQIITSNLDSNKKAVYKNIVYKALVLEPPEHRKNSLKTNIRIIEVNDSLSELRNCKVVTFFKKDVTDIKAGDVLLLKSDISKIDDPKNPYELNYRKIMQFKSIVFRTFVKKDEFRHAGSKITPGIWAALARNKILENYRKSGVGGRELGVLAALTVGDRDEITIEINRAYAATGIVHILSVSGLHVGIIYMVLNQFLFFLNRRKQGQIVKMIIIIGSLWLFALIAGFKPSAIRAAFMFSLLQAGLSLKRNVEPINTIAVSAFFILLFNPLQIADIGFQLSYLAVTGIIVFQKNIYSWWIPRNYIVDKTWALVSVSIAAQIITVPLTMFYFHQFPVYFWLTNVFAIPLTALITYSGGILAITTPLSLGVGKIFALLPVWIIKILNKIIEVIANFPFATITNINTDFCIMILLYAFIIIISIYFFSHKIRYLISALIVVFVLINYETFRKHIYTSQKTFTVYHIPGKSAFSLISDKKSLLVTSIIDDYTKNYYIYNHILRKGVAHNILDIRKNEPFNFKDDVFFCQSYGKNIFFSMENFKGVLIAEKLNDKVIYERKLNLDCIILSENVNISAKQLKELFDFRLVIFDTSNSIWYVKKLKDQFKSEKVNVYDVLNNKAFERDFNY